MKVEHHATSFLVTHQQMASRNLAMSYRLIPIRSFQTLDVERLDV